MWPFNRNQVDETGMPPEVHQYYQAEHRERVGVAWALAFGTLLVTVGLALGGFYGGRAVYRKVAKNDKKPETTQVATKSKNETSSTQTPSSQNTTSDNSESDPAEDTNNNPSPPSSNNTSTPTDTTTTPSTNPPTTTPNPSPAASTTTPNTQLPHTGPMDIVALFIGVTVLSTLGHVIYNRYRLV